MKRSMFALGSAFAAGAAVSYLLDPDRGHDRRARLQGSVVTGVSQVTDAREQVKTTVQDLTSSSATPAGSTPAPAANSSVPPAGSIEVPEDMPTPIGVADEVEDEASTTGDVP